MMSRILTIALSVVTAAAPTRASAAGATIRGRIVAIDTGQPLRGAWVSIGPPERTNPGDNRTARTDADGRYTVANVPPGKYSLSIARSGYLPMQYGQRRPLETPRLLDVRDASAINADFALQRSAVIGGRISDERGEPAAGVLVFAMRPVYMDGRRQLAPQSSAGGFNVRTDESGRYRISALAPGSYVVMATSRDTWNARVGSDVVMGFAATFFPGTVDAAAARAVTIAYAEQKTDVSFSLTVVRAVRVSGTAFDSHGKPLAGQRIGLTQTFHGADGGGGVADVANATVAPDGTFVMPHVLPGEYKLQARRPGSGPGRDDEAAAQRIKVGNANVDGVVVKTTAAWSITGQIVTEAGVAPSLSPSAARVVAMVPEPTNPRGGPPGGKTRIDDDWTFTVDDLFGPARLGVNLPQGWTLKAIERDGRDITDASVEGTSGQALGGVRIVVSNRVTTMSGRTIAPGGGATNGATVIVFAADAHRWRENSRFVRVVRPNDEGAWEISGLPAGDYLVIAIDYVPQGLWNDPDYLATLRPRAQPIAMDEGGSPFVTLRVLESS
jgi:carboxypeptidase family protein